MKTVCLIVTHDSSCLEALMWTFAATTNIWTKSCSTRHELHGKPPILQLIAASSNNHCSIFHDICLCSHVFLTFLRAPTCLSPPVLLSSFFIFSRMVLWMYTDTKQNEPCRLTHDTMEHGKWSSRLALQHSPTYFVERVDVACSPEHRRASQP